MKQKRSSANKSSTNKQSNGPAGSNDDSIRAAILDEATIVCILTLYVECISKSNLIFLVFFALGRSSPLSALVVPMFSVN